MFVRNKVFRKGIFQNNARSYFLSHTSNNFGTDDELFVLSDLFEWKTPTFRTKLFNFQLERDERVRVSVRV